MNTESIEKEKLIEPEIDLQEDPAPSNIPIKERVHIFANIIIDRILELQKTGALPVGVKKI